MSAEVGPPTALDGLDAAGLQGELAAATEARDPARAAVADADQWCFNARRAGDVDTAERVKVVVARATVGGRGGPTHGCGAAQAALAVLAAHQAHPGRSRRPTPRACPSGSRTSSSSWPSSWPR